MKAKTSKLKRFLSCLMVFAMVASLVPITALAAVDTTGGVTYVLEASDLEAFDSTKANGETTVAGTDDFFTLIWRSNSRVDSSTSNFEDGYTTGMRINFQGSGVSLEGGAIRFTTTAAATVKVWWTLGGAGRNLAILDSTGEKVTGTELGADVASGTRTISTLELEEGGTYYLGGDGANSYICKVEITVAPTTYALEASALEPFDSTKANGETTVAGTDDFFTLIWRSNSRVDSSNSTFEDGYTTGMRINFQGAVTLESGAIRFTTTAAATVKVWWTLGGAGRNLAILDSTGEKVTGTELGADVASGTRTISTLELEEGGTYYLGGDGANSYICKVEVTTGGGAMPERGPWSEVAAPVITGVALDESDNGKINVTVAGEVGYDAADRITVTMTASDGTTAEQSSSRDGSEHTVSFAPADSGTYTFSVVATREGEEEVHAGAETVDFDFVFPLTAPVIKGAYNDGNGTMTVEWNAVHEAESYNVSVGEQTQNVTGLTATFEGLTVGEEVTFTVAAVRGDEIGPESTVTATVGEDAEMRWAYSAFGNSTSVANNSYSGSFSEGEVRVWSINGSGKIQESSHDGISFYYTAIDPKTTNFVLQATAHVNTWTYSNGQEGFGLAALDRVGVYGSSDTGAIFYNNDYMTAITRFSSFRLGVGAVEQYGTNRDNYANPEGDGFTKTIASLSGYFGGSGTRNIVGNATNQSSISGNIENLLVDFTLRLEKNNTGYFMTYIAPNGVEYTHKTYDPDNLTVLDDQVYIGFFAARNVDVTFSDITLTFSDPATDAPAEERPTEYVTPSYSFIDRGVSNSPEGEIVYRGNVTGTLLVVDQNGNRVYNERITANKNVFIPVSLTEGTNTFTAIATPDPDFHPDGLSYRVLTDYSARVLTKTVTYTVDDRDVIYVGANGTANAAGTREDPTTLAAAVRFPKPGATIVLLEGEYNIGNVSIYRGINGTEDAMITLTADEGVRPVLTGSITLEGNYWHFYGFDVTKSSSNAVHVAGSYNLIERIQTYKNGNTGLQISRQGSYEGIAEWPSYNTILNCSSYLNSDAGFEDADGFAAKLTVGEGNLFDGCISAYNADDGWDLFARGENIGAVTLVNCVAFKNGWLWNYDHWWTGTDGDKDIINAGNGNGFKMGGSGYEGRHTIINSVSFANKANGITCNSCPDIVIDNCISFDNETANLSLYSSISNQLTAFVVNGYISYGKSAGSADSLRPTGGEVLTGSNNYYFDGTKSVNTEGVEVTDAWFVSLDTDTAINDRENGITRNEDGSINMNGYLELTEAAPKDAGARDVVSVGEIEVEETEHGSVASDHLYASAGTIVTVTANPGTGYTVDTITVSGANGEVEVIDNGDGTYSFVMPEGNVTITVTFKIGLADLDPNEWYNTYTDYVVENGLMVGDGDGSFRPNDEITRAELMTILARVAGYEPDQTKGANWYDDAVAWAVANKISDGTDPEDFVTREQLATMIYRCAGEPDVAGVEVNFADAGKISDWAVDAIAWCVANGILNGDAESNTLRPDDTALRCEAAKMITVFAQLGK